MARRLSMAIVAVFSVIVTTLPLPSSLQLPSLLSTPVAEAAAATELGCEQPTSLNQYVGCWLKIVRPAADTGATYGQLGFHFPNQFPGIASFSAPGQQCTQDNINGHKRFTCFGETPLGGMTQVDFVLHVAGTCGQKIPVNANYANVYGELSAYIYADINFPACDTGNGGGGSGQCNDGVDNDKDGVKDGNDPACYDGGAFDPTNNEVGNTTLSLTRTGPDTVTSGQSATYTVKVTNTGNKVARNVVVTEVFPADAGVGAGAPCPVRSEVVDTVPMSVSTCSLGNLAIGQTVTLSFPYNFPATPVRPNKCGTRLPAYALADLANGGRVTAADPSPTLVCGGGNSSTASSISSANNSSGNLGCIEVRKETFNTQNQPLFPVAQFTFSLDGSRQAFNNANGVARFENVAAGTHIVTEQIPTSWEQLSISPANGTVNVAAGSSCAVVTFRNRQTVGGNGGTFTVTKTDNRSTASVGENLDYTITIKNTSNQVAQNIVVTDILPNELSFVSASNNATVNGQTVTWVINSIPANQSVNLTLTAKIRNGTPNGTQIRNTVAVNGSNATGEDVTTVTGAISNDRVSIKVSDTPDPVKPGDDLKYRIEICNEDDDDIGDLSVVQILPDDVEVIDDGDGDEDDGTITWEIDLDEDECETMHVTVEVSDDLDDGDELESLILAGDSSEDETTEISDDDDDDRDNDDEDGDLNVDKSASTYEVFPGGIVEYTLTIDNDTGKDLEDLVVTDRIRGNGFTIIDDGNADRTSGNTLTWNIDQLDDGETKIIRYRISISASAPSGTVINNDVSVEGDNEDDKDSVTVTVINNLPQTGFKFGGNGSQYLRPYTASASTTPWTAVLSMVISGIGAGAGMGLGRKFLI